MQADRIDLARGVEHGERGTAVGEEVLRVNLDETERRPALEHLTVVRLAQADAGQRHVGGDGLHDQGPGLSMNDAPRAGSAVVASKRSPSLLLQRGLGLVGRLAAQLLARALGHVLPIVGTHVGLGLAGARVRARQVGAIVLPGLGDAEALLLAARVGCRGGIRAGPSANTEARADEAISWVLFITGSSEK